MLVAARDVVMAHGPRRATLAEVARQAGVSRMTVYRRYESFDRILSALLTVELAQLLAGIPAPPSGADARSRAAGTVAELTGSIAAHPLVRRVLEVDPEALVPLMVSRFGRTQLAAVEVLEPLLVAGMASRGGDGSIRDTDPVRLARAMVTAAQSFVFAAAALEGLGDADGIRREWSIMVSGMLAPLTSDGAVAGSGRKGAAS